MEYLTSNRKTSKHIVSSQASLVFACSCLKEILKFSKWNKTWRTHQTSCQSWLQLTWLSCLRLSWWELLSTLHMVTVSISRWRLILLATSFLSQRCSWCSQSWPIIFSTNPRSSPLSSDCTNKCSAPSQRIPNSWRRKKRKTPYGATYSSWLSSARSSTQASKCHRILTWSYSWLVVSSWWFYWGFSLWSSSTRRWDMRTSTHGLEGSIISWWRLWLWSEDSVSTMA